MTEGNIIKYLASYTDHRLYPFMCSNIFIYGWECDFWTMKQDGETREFEVKISRSDYFHDSKKEKHNGTAGANFFYYVVPEGLIKKEEVDIKYGLIYISETGSVSIIKKPRRLHTKSFDQWKILANRMYWRFYQLWREKWISKELTREEFFAGFNIDLSEPDPIINESICTK